VRKIYRLIDPIRSVPRVPASTRLAAGDGAGRQAFPE